MKKLFTITIALISATTLLKAQNPLPESAIPPTGINYQNGPGANNSQGWTYPYGIKLSLFSNTSRNFEIMSTGKTAASTLAFRTYLDNPAGWTPWREFVFKNSIGRVGIGTNSPRFHLDIKTNSSFEGNNLYFGDRRFYLAGVTGTGAQMYGGLILNNLGNGVRALDLVAGNHDFETANNPSDLVMRVQSNGNVGIGTENPTEPLHVSDVSGEFTVGRPGSENNHRLTIDGNNGYENQIYFRRQAARIFTGNRNLTLSTGPATNNLVVHANGNIGVGTSSPQFALHINSPDNQLMRFTSTNGTWLDFESTNAGTGKRVWTLGHVGTNGQFGIAQRDGVDEYRLVIESNGNIGIGTTNPSNKLEVNGNIRAKELTLEASPWPDYVFESTYDLKPLEEVKEFISLHKHLPEVPSAQKVSESGFQVAEMNMLLLKKIEEMTLYQIELMEALKEQKEEIKSLKEQLEN